MQEGRGVTQAVSYLGYPGLSGRGNLMGGSGIIHYLDVLLVAISYSCQYIYLRRMSFEMDASSINSLMSGTYTTSSLTMRKAVHKPKLRDNLQNIWPVLFKTVKFIKIKCEKLS